MTGQQIRKLELENVLSFEEEVVEFRPGVNLIAPYDTHQAHHVGKTTILRALSAILLNQGTLPDILRAGASQYRATLTLSSSDIIARVRGGTTNQYVVNGRVIDNPGTSVPSVVSEITRVLPVPVGKEAEAIIQIAAPYDARFLIGMSGPARASLLAALSGADRVRPAQKRADGRVSDAKRELASKQKLLAQVEESIKQLEWVPAANTLIEEIDALKERLDADQQTRQLAQQARTTIVSAKLLRGYVDKAEVKCNELGEKFTVLSEEQTALITAQDSLTEIREVKKRASLWLSAKQEISAQIDAVGSAGAGIDKDLETLANMNESLTKVTEGITEFCAAKQQAEKLRSAVEETETKVEASGTDLKDALTAAGKCPTCGSGKRSWKI